MTPNLPLRIRTLVSRRNQSLNGSTSCHLAHFRQLDSINLQCIFFSSGLRVPGLSCAAIRNMADVIASREWRSALSTVHKTATCRPNTSSWTIERWNNFVQYKSHIGQDRWVAEIFGFRKNAYFLEFGALDGLLTSNTYALEKDLDWNGITVEANPTYYPAVCRNRNCITINAALWPVSRQIVEMVDAHGLSSVVEYKDGDVLASVREEITLRKFKVDTISPNDLLDRFQAPEYIEYLSLDIEGCEFPVLKAIDLNRYKIALMTIEHSDDQERMNIVREYLAQFGYSVVRRLYDDWFFHEAHLNQLAAYTDPISIHNEIERTFDIVTV